MIFVTGATGVLGGFITENLLKNGYKVLALKRKGSVPLYKSIQNHQRLNWVEGSLETFDVLLEAIKQCTTVLHCAGYVSLSNRQQDALNNVNIKGTQNVVDAALEAGGKQFIHISSIAALGGAPKGVNIIDEELMYDRSKANTPYGKSKYMGELEVWRGFAEGLSGVVLCPSVVLLPPPANQSSAALVDWALSAPKFYPPGHIDFVDARDVFKAVHYFIQQPINQPEKFILSGVHLPYHTLLNYIAQKLGKPKPKVKITRFMAMFGLVLSATQSFFNGKPAKFNRAMANSVFSNTEYNGNKITLQTTVSYTHWHQTIQWIIENY